MICTIVDMKIRNLHVQVPEKEWTLFKLFAINHGLTMQKLVRYSISYYMQESKKSKILKRRDEEKQEN